MKQQHQTFIIEMIKHGDKTMAYQKAYPKCTDEESARKSAERLLRHHPEILEEIEEATAQIRHQAYTDAYRLYTEQQKTKLLSIMDKREILARIAKCEIKVCRYIKDGDRYRMLFEDPHPREIMKAIEADGRIEDRCNRARNLADPKLSQFNVYIDGRPCDDPTAPINPDLPPGIVMLPRTRNLNTEQGNNLEQSQEKDSFPVFREGGTNEVSDGRVDARRTLAQDETLIEEQGIISEHLSRQGGENVLSPSGGGGEVRAGGGTLAPEKTRIEEPGIISEQNELSPAGGGGEVRAGGGILAPEKSLIEEQGIISEQNELSPAVGGGEARAGGGTLVQDETLIEEHGNISEHLSRQSGENELSPAGGGGEARAGGGPLVPEKIPIEEQGIITEQTTETALPLRLSDSAVQHSNTTPQISTRHTSPPEFIPPSAGGDLGVQLALENSPLYSQYLALYQKRKLQAEDLMCASFYSQNKAAEEAAPPPHILTDEEVRQFHAEADRKLAEKKKQPKQPYNTFGKMYFPPEGRK